MLVIQLTKFSHMLNKRDWFWHHWRIPVLNGIAYIPRGYVEGAAVKVTNARGHRVFGVEVASLTTIPREIEIGEDR